MNPVAALLSEARGASAAIVDAASGETLHYDELPALAALGAKLKGDTRHLVVVCLGHDLGAAKILLGTLAAGHAVLPLGSQMPPSVLHEIARAYGAAWLVAPQAVLAAAGKSGIVDLGHGYFGTPWGQSSALHPQLSLLLPTSGSTGPPKTARISGQALNAAVGQARSAIDLQSDERTLLGLPIVHIYGLMTLLSNLLAGATVILGKCSVMDPAFQELCDRWRPTTLPGVAFTFDMMRKIGWERLGARSLGKLTHSGDRLSPETCEWAVANQVERDVLFFRMYGMTETTGRISVLPPSEFVTCPSSVGRAVPGGAIHVEDGEVTYSGPNLMAGYAHGAACLASLDTPAFLRTGDLGLLDVDGRLHLTGRRTLIAKILGVRVGLEDLENAFAPICAAAAVSTEKGIALFLEEKSSVAVEAHIAQVAALFRIPRACIDVRFGYTLPRSTTGKLLRSALSGPISSASAAGAIA